MIKNNFCCYKKIYLCSYDGSFISILPLCLILIKKVVTDLSLVTDIWGLGRFCVEDKIEELFRYLSCLIKIKMNITVGFRADTFFATEGFILKLIIGKKNTHVFNFLSLFRAYGSQRYHCQSFVSPCHILLLYIGYIHKDNSFIYY